MNSRDANIVMRRRRGVVASANTLCAMLLLLSVYHCVLFGQTVLDESWALSVNGQTVTVNDDGSFTIPNISAPDQFGPDGPGSVPDFVGDDYVRVVGHSTADGTNRYVASEFFKIRQGQTVFISNLTFSHVPPRKPEALSIGLTNRSIFLGQSFVLPVVGRYADGSVGQLGIGTFTRTNTPQQIGTNANWQSVVAGASHTVALRVTGTLWAWGNNIVGQLGNGSLTTTNTPQRIGNSTNWQTIAAGGAHTLASSNGTFWAWGLNASGQLGNGTFISTNRPQPILTNIAWRTLTAGGTGTGGAASSFDGHTLALRDDGTLWVWGDNSYGQLALPVPWLPYPVLGGALWGPPDVP